MTPEEAHAVADELRGWAEDLENYCWAYVALPGVLRARADEVERGALSDEKPPS